MLSFEKSAVSTVTGCFWLACLSAGSLHVRWHRFLGCHSTQFTGSLQLFPRHTHDLSHPSLQDKLLKGVICTCCAHVHPCPCFNHLCFGLCLHHLTEVLLVTETWHHFRVGSEGLCHYSDSLVSPVLTLTVPSFRGTLFSMAHGSPFS